MRKNKNKYSESILTTLKTCNETKFILDFYFNYNVTLVIRYIGK